MIPKLSPRIFFFYLHSFSNWSDTFSSLSIFQTDLQILAAISTTPLNTKLMYLVTYSSLKFAVNKYLKIKISKNQLSDFPPKPAPPTCFPMPPVAQAKSLRMCLDLPPPSYIPSHQGILSVTLKQLIQHPTILTTPLLFHHWHSEPHQLLFGCL